MCGGGWEVVVRGTEARESRHAQLATLLRELLPFGHPSQSPESTWGPSGYSCERAYPDRELPLSWRCVSQQLWESVQRA